MKSLFLSISAILHVSMFKKVNLKAITKANTAVFRRACVL